MQLHNLYFSPTGATKKVADILAGRLGGTSQDIDLSIYGCDYSNHRFATQDLCLVSVPAFGGRVPPPALAALGQMRAAQTPTVVVVTYGNRHYDDALLELGDTLAPLGFHVIVGIAAVTEHSIVRQFGAGRPTPQDTQELEAFADKIKGALDRQAPLAAVALPGNRPYRDYHSGPMKPKGGKSCTKCGLCAQRCPVGAISSLEPRFTDKAACITCMRCISICPKQTRKISPLLLRGASRSLEKSCTQPKENLYWGSL